MSDGTLSVRRRDVKASEALRETQNHVDLPIFSDINIGHGPENTLSKTSPDTGEQRLQVQTSKKLKEHDKLLKIFKYSAALDSVLKKVGFFGAYSCSYGR
jgi:U3 small nucleolar RNA-associated protein 15